MGLLIKLVKLVKLVIYFADNDQYRLLQSIFCAQGRGRRPNSPNFGNEASNSLILQLYFLKLQTHASWDKVETWVAHVLPVFPRNKVRYLIEKTVMSLKLIKREEWHTFLNITTDLNRIGM